VLYLICHGKQTPQSTMLYLVSDDGTAAPITGETLKNEIAALDAVDRPLLAVLVACEGGRPRSTPARS